MCSRCASWTNCWCHNKALHSLATWRASSGFSEAMPANLQGSMRQKPLRRLVWVTIMSVAACQSENNLVWSSLGTSNDAATTRSLPVFKRCKTNRSYSPVANSWALLPLSLQVACSTLPSLFTPRDAEGAGKTAAAPPSDSPSSSPVASLRSFCPTALIRERYHLLSLRSSSWQEHPSAQLDWMSIAPLVFQ